MLPFVLIYLLLAENKFKIPLLASSDIIYLLIVLAGFYILFINRCYVLFMISSLYFPLKILNYFTQSVILNNLSLVFISILFISSGAVMYGQNYRLLNKQLIFFLSLCIPIMILQIVGADPFFFIWDTSFLDNPLSSYTHDDLGYYRNIHLFPTIFISQDQIEFVIGQARPAGLTYNNNVLSVFVVLTLATNITARNIYNLKLSDYIVNLCAILTMSKLVLVSGLLIYVISFIILSKRYNILIMKMMIIFFGFLFLYYLIFPGLFLRNLSMEMVAPSLLIRLNSFLYSANLIDLVEYINFNFSDYTKMKMDNVSSNTIYSDIMASELSLVYLTCVILFICLYIKSLRVICADDRMFYLLLLIALMLSQLGVSFYIATSFQLILGCALYPIYYYFKNKNFIRFL